MENQNHARINKKPSMQVIEEYEKELDLIAFRKAKEKNEQPILWEEAKKRLKMDLFQD